MLDTPVAYKTLMCLVCGWIYSEKEGDPEHHLPAGTRWDDIPDSWECPECGVKKVDFTMVDM